MSTLSPLLLQSCAVIATATAGALLLRRGVASARDGLVGVGLLVAALLTAVDALPGPAHGLPLAGAAVAAFALLAALPAERTLLALGGDPLRLGALGAIATLALHRAHRLWPTQPVHELGIAWNWPDLVVAVVLGWLARAGGSAPAEQRFLFGAAAIGLFATSWAEGSATAIAAGMLAIGTAPILLRGLQWDLRGVAVPAATAAAATIACALRARAVPGAPSAFAELKDPLLLLAALFVAFGAALLRDEPAGNANDAAPAPGEEDRATASPTPATVDGVDTTPGANETERVHTDAAVLAATSAGATAIERVLGGLGGDDGAHRGSATRERFRAPASDAGDRTGAHDPTTTSATAVAAGDAVDAGVAASAPAPVADDPAPFATRELVRDLRAPLTSLLASASLLRDGGADQTAQLEALQRYGRELGRTLADLEDFEQLARGASELASEPFDFHQLVRECADAAAAGLRDSGGELRVDVIAGTPRWVQGDAVRVRQLLGRLVAIAARDASLGPIDATVCADATSLHVVLANRSTTTALAPGFDFAFCRQLARTLGGDLRRQLRPNGGVELHATIGKQLAPEWEIDLLQEDRARAAATPPANDAPVRGKVLLIDDSPDHQRLIGHLLARAGAEVTTAEGGNVALHLLQATTFDLVLLDMQMPDKSGYDTVAELRQLGITTPVLALTADSGAGDVERCLAAGCNGHLAKPVELPLLQQALAAHLPAASD